MNIRMKVVRYAAVILCGVIGVALLGLVAIWFAATTLPSWLYWHYKTKAESYISEIESFKREHGYYPDEDTQTIFQRADDNTYFYESDGQQYCIGFNIGFDYTYRYCSATQKWTFGAVGPIHSTQTNSPR